MLAKKKKQLKAAATAVYAIGQMAKGASEAATPIKDRPLLHRLLEDGMVLIMLVCLLGVLWLDLHLPAWFAAWLRSLPDGARGFLLFVEIGGVLAAVHLGIAAVVGGGPRALDARHWGNQTMSAPLVQPCQLRRAVPSRSLAPVGSGREERRWTPFELN